MDKEKLRVAIENAGFMTKLSVIGGIVGLLLTILVFWLGIINGFSGSDVFILGIVPCIMVVLFSAAALIYGILSGNAANEAEEKQLLERRKDNQAFKVEEDVRFTAERSFANYKRFAPYVLNILGAIIIAVAIVMFLRPAEELIPQKVDYSKFAFVSAMMMCVSVFCGAFFIGQARNQSFRWLRTVGSWLIVVFLFMALATVSSLLRLMRDQIISNVDAVFTKIALVLLILLGVELIINFIVEFYRPRTVKESHPIFESSLLAVFTEPGGVMRNFAHTLDYQFGFKVSGTWIYSFVERSLFPVLVLWIIILWGFSSITEVGPNEVGVRQYFGKVSEHKLLTPGVYFTLPWPFGSINRISTARIHEVTVGLSAHEDEDEEAADEHGHNHGGKPPKRPTGNGIVLWTNEHDHGGEENKFILAVEPENIRDVDSSTTTISFLSLIASIQYHIKPDGVFDYLYNVRDPNLVLQNWGEAVVTEIMASESLMHVMASGRHEVEHTILERLQKLADEQKLGVELVEVSLLDVHPPVKTVAPAFQRVLAAMEDKETLILMSETYRERILPDAQSESNRIVADAQSYRYSVQVVAQAESERFLKQLKAYEVLPALFKLRTYLTMFESDTHDIRKYILSAGLKNEVYELNFEKSSQMDLMGASMDAFAPSNQ